MSDEPRIFCSYSHDDETHKAWVLNLATRLVANGVDVVLDQWDMSLGGDLPFFMEQGLDQATRILSVCSETYVRKANAGQGGVGYEKMILTGQLMSDVTSDRIIPLIRNNELKPLVPTFLISRMFVDFRDDTKFESSYAELLRDIHKQPVRPRPPLGKNPFAFTFPEIEPRLSFASERYVSAQDSGVVTFDYSNNDGKYAVGAGDMMFETAWSSGGSTSIYAYRDPPSIRTVALASGVDTISKIEDASIFDSSSRTRSPHLGQIVVWQNTAGYWLATKIESLQSRGHGADADKITFSYAIAPNKAADFRTFAQ